MKAVCKKHGQVLNVIGRGIVTFSTKIWCHISGYLNRHLRCHRCLKSCRCAAVENYHIVGSIRRNFVYCLN